MATIYEVLRQDHQACRKMIQNVLELTPSEDENISFSTQEIVTEIQSHERAEEQALYEVLKERSSDPDLVADVYLCEAQHQELEMLLGELIAESRFGEEFRVQLLKLFEALERHWAEEEETLFNKTRTLLSEKEARELGSIMIELRDSLREEIRADFKNRSDEDLESLPQARGVARKTHFEPGRQLT